VTEGLRPVDELQALRRVATLVAEGVPPQQLFAVVASEVARVLEVPIATVLRYEPDGTATSCARSQKGPPLELGTRFALDGPSVLGRILTTGKPARVDDYSLLNGELPDAVRIGGIRSSVGTPIVVSGRLWGAMVASNSHAEPLPEGTEERLADFTELLATAIANAESRVALERLADEQAALRRVATLVAQGAPPADICAAVSDEVDGLFDCGAGVAWFDDDGPATVFTGVSKRITVPIGTRFEFQDGMASVEVYRTHRSARVDRNDWSTGDGALPTTARRVGLVSSVASPIVVDGRLWGTMNLWSTNQLLPPDTGERLEKFTELVGTAIANAESREALRLLADEQAALRRIATLVARSVPAEELFAAVTDEVGRLFGSNTATVAKFEDEPPAVVLVGVGKGMTGVPVGFRSPLNPGLVATAVFHTGRSARVDDRDWSSLSEPLRGPGRRLHLVASVGSPITVNHRVWGALNLSASEALPVGTEARLDRFSELVGIAIASAEAQEAVRLLADEQAALRRVATLVAQGVAATEIFQAVSEEVAHLFGENLAAVNKFDRDAPVVTFVGIAKRVEGVEIGTRVELSEETSTGRVYATGRPARVDRADWSTAASPMGQLSGRIGIVSSVASPIIVEGRLWGAISALSVTKTLPPETERRLERFSDLVATAIANAESRSELAASRRRIVATSDEARRRVERDLHDGTQQRLVSLALAVRATEEDVPADLHSIRSELTQIATELGEAVVELQEITRGIHPASLEQVGLGAALRTLARRSPIPVELNLAIEGELSEPVEVAAYYVASEALANAAKHAQATGIEMSLVRRDDSVIMSIRDDGIGHADPDRGSGLVGLTDRVEALGGSLEIRSTPGYGTRITATLPLAIEKEIDLD
jgi:signal transduction histidine kinase